MCSLQNSHWCCRCLWLGAGWGCCPAAIPQANLAISLTWCFWIIIIRTSKIVSLPSFSSCPNIIICWKNILIFKTQLLSRHCFSHPFTVHLLTAWHILSNLAFVSFNNGTLSSLSKWIFCYPYTSYASDKAGYLFKNTVSWFSSFKDFANALSKAFLCHVLDPDYDCSQIS